MYSSCHSKKKKKRPHWLEAMVLWVVVSACYLVLVSSGWLGVARVLWVVSRWLLTGSNKSSLFGWVGLCLLQREVSVYEMYNKSPVVFNDCTNSSLCCHSDKCGNTQVWGLWILGQSLSTWETGNTFINREKWHGNVTLGWKTWVDISKGLLPDQLSKLFHSGISGHVIQE